MKVRLLILVAVATTVLGAQAFAQEEGGLERALADLNNGVVAPIASNVSADGSSGLNVSGNIRVRNTAINPANGARASRLLSGGLVNGFARDAKNIDARLHLNFAFDVNENASAFIQVNASENWGAAGGVNFATGEGTGLPGTGGNLNVAAINQGYFTSADTVGDGGELLLGRRAFTLGSGRILATDDWNQVPDTYSGIWYTNSWDEFTFEAFMINDIFSGIGLSAGTGVGLPAGTGDVDLFGLVVDFETDAVEFMGNLGVQPYIMRSAVQASVGPGGTAKTWLGVEIDGTFMDEAIMWDVEGVWVNSGIVGAPGMSNFNAWAADIDVNLEQWLPDMPLGLSPVVEVGIAQADRPGITVNPAYHNTAGMADVLGSNGFYAPIGIPPGTALPLGFSTGGGVWNGLADTWQVAITLEPIEKWPIRGAFVNFDDNTAGTVLPGDASEIDLSVSHSFDNTVDLFLGWANVDYNALSSDAYVVYLTLGLAF